MVACREGARDAYLHSSLGQGAATRNGQMGAYASGFYSTHVLCGGVYSAHTHTPSAVGLYKDLCVSSLFVKLGLDHGHKQ